MNLNSSFFSTLVYSDKQQNFELNCIKLKIFKHLAKHTQFSGRNFDGNLPSAVLEPYRNINLLDGKFREDSSYCERRICQETFPTCRTSG